MLPFRLSLRRGSKRCFTREDTRSDGLPANLDGSRGEPAHAPPVSPLCTALRPGHPALLPRALARVAGASAASRARPHSGCRLRHRSSPAAAVGPRSCGGTGSLPRDAREGEPAAERGGFPHTAGVWRHPASAVSRRRLRERRQHLRHQCRSAAGEGSHRDAAGARSRRSARLHQRGGVRARRSRDSPGRRAVAAGGGHHPRRSRCAASAGPGASTGGIRPVRHGPVTKPR